MSKKKKQKRIEGIFRATEKGYGFIQIDEQKEEIFVPRNSVNNALNGDKVQAVVYKQQEKDRRAEAKIVKILKREKETVV